MSSQTAYINVLASATATKNGRRLTASIQDNRSFADGITAGLSNKGYYDQLTIAATGSPHALDFAGGGLVDLNGDAITWVDMVGLVIASDSGNTVNITVGNHANPLDFGCGGSGTIYIKPGETKVLIDVSTDPGYAITAGSADTLKLAIPSGSNQIYQIWAIGRDA